MSGKGHQQGKAVDVYVTFGVLCKGGWVAVCMGGGGAISAFAPRDNGYLTLRTVNTHM